ncbi:hypothetical protein [Thalassospira tepidiphila]|uniref:Uncharacterized protein n=1 Tax=Thalassospira tepidiphila MCCC 1A03514 TaxID=1177930 RepID=A0A853L5N5_9PROT|nr:hypothetical protein [Thalassospira tepidiphila]OAZ12041.1 hypothetical protein TH4_02935 [Thalassospira tepidiphila MCCC 1A03514]
MWGDVVIRAYLLLFRQQHVPAIDLETAVLPPEVDQEIKTEKGGKERSKAKIVTFDTARNDPKAAKRQQS